MSTQIYLVMSVTGEYEEYREHPVHGWSYKADAERQLVTLAEEQKDWNEFVKNIRAFETDYQAKHPEPVYPREEFKERPRWPKGMRKEQITQEMKQARQDVLDFNEKLLEQFADVNDRYCTIKRETVLAHFKALGTRDKFLEAIVNDVYMTEDNIQYQIQEITFN